MAITRKLVAQDSSEDNQWLKVDHASRYIENDGKEWQFIFGPESSLSSSSQVVKIAAKFDENTLNNIKFTAYLYDLKNGSVANAASCVFKVYKVTVPDWSEVLISSISAAQLFNNYFYVQPILSALSSINFDGGDTIMVEAEIVRFGITYRERIYVNHLGIYDNLLRAKQEIDFLDLVKADE